MFLTLPLVCHDPGNEKKLDPGLAPSLDLRNVPFPFHEGVPG